MSNKTFWIHINQLINIWIHMNHLIKKCGLVSQALGIKSEKIQSNVVILNPTFN